MWFLATMACTKHKKFDGLTTDRTKVTDDIDIPSCNSNTPAPCLGINDQTQKNTVRNTEHN